MRVAGDAGSPAGHRVAIQNGESACQPGDSPRGQLSLSQLDVDSRHLLPGDREALLRWGESGGCTLPPRLLNSDCSRSGFKLPFADAGSPAQLFWEIFPTRSAKWQPTAAARL